MTAAHGPPAPSGPPIFVVGIPRSGTTLLAAMLSAHSRIDCGPESRFFARFRHLPRLKRHALVARDGWPVRAVEFLCSLDNMGVPVHELYGLTRDDLSAWLADREPSVARMLEALTAQRAERSGKPRWAEKTPRHLTQLPLIRRTWPEAQVIRIVRDPRDVAVSLSRMPFAGTSLVGNIIHADRYDRDSRDFMRTDAGAVTLRYEDLLTDAERELRRVCEFIDEPYEAGMLTERAADSGIVAAHEWWKGSVSGPLDPSRVGRWRTEMPSDVQRFAALHMAGFIGEHGYEGAATPRREVAVVPVGDWIPVKADPLVLGLAAIDAVIMRPTPHRPSTLAGLPDLVFIGTRGQLEPGRGAPLLRRVEGLTRLALLLVSRRLRGRPILWLRISTKRRRRPRDAGEFVLFVLLRLLARSARAPDVATLLAPPPAA